MAKGRRLENFDDIKRSLKNGYGLGEREKYKPWLRVQDVPSKGQSAKIAGLKTNRLHHTLSQLESQFFYLSEFSNAVIDIREQYPLLPLTLSKKIADEIGVEHPRSPKTGLPIVMTTDFLLTLQHKGRICYEAINVKPENELADFRVAEKIEIERIWWQLLGVKFRQFVGSSLTACQAANIAWATDVLRHKNISESEVNRSLLHSITPGVYTT